MQAGETEDKALGADLDCPGENSDVSAEFAGDDEVLNELEVPRDCVI